MAIQPITESEIALSAVSSLPSRPNAGVAFGGRGMTPRELKAAFDRLPRLAIDKINEILASVEDGTLCQYLNLPDEDQTLAGFIEAVRYALSDIANTLSQKISRNEVQDCLGESDLPVSAGAVHALIEGLVSNAALEAALQGKQDTLTFDAFPTRNSTNPVTSDGICRYFEATYPTVVQEITQNQPENYVPSTAAVLDFINGPLVDALVEEFNLILDEFARVYNILGQTVITETEIEDTYVSRVTAGGLTLISDSETVVSRISGSTKTQITSANKIDLASAIGGGVTVGGITCTAENNTLSFRGTTTETSGNLITQMPTLLEVGKTYTLRASKAFTDEAVGILLAVYSEAGEELANTGATDDPVTFNVTSPATVTVFFSTLDGSIGNAVDETVSFTVNEGEAALAYDDYASTLVNGTYAGILSKNADGTQESTLAIDDFPPSRIKPVPLGKWDYMDTTTTSERRPIDRHTYQFAFADVSLGYAVVQGSGNKYFSFIPNGVVPTAGLSQTEDVVSNFYRGRSVASDKSITIQIGNANRPLINIRDDSLLVYTDGAVDAEASVASFTQALAQRGLVIAYNAKEPLYTAQSSVDVPNTYTVWNGGTETSISGDEISVVQTYMEKVGG